MGNLWVVSAGNLLKFDGTTFTDYGRPIDCAVGYLEFDAGGALWILGSCGLYKFVDGDTKSFDLKTALSITPETLSESNDAFIIYPNPASTAVSFRFGEGISPQTIAVYDASGRLIYSGKLNNALSATLSELNIAQNGLYLLKITDQSGRIHTQRLIVE
ncbi:T9SS type A sorting domain-containing protein [Viscerimonas tarda]